MIELEESLADVPIVLVTGAPNAQARVNSLDKPLRRRIVGCVRKPFDVDALLSKVAAVPFTAAPVAAAPLTAAPAPR